ncbi:prepilin-type N-terminal cleavage/methylation domain-containing protein [Pararoseomonas indoligenes]|uniref:Prepilin-type N-terminal cleavage/methylation domain-containing protein n=1 Tax=Roseomonas indoligenes TaxID=2820811 RepID=A0A940S5Z2_9PROT|nr:prepilin-type N-terminal cleavage/methylation domain-containing protein [Pararoseomonas indoligenes]MBP0494951.1 prepilin-type N-terminal cleavage/methylation domain-containing protein [Pararoseomonas indoligenes]
MRRPPPREEPVRDRGFTLLEVLVALVVLGFLMAGLTQGTRFGLRALDRQAARAATAGDLDAVDRVLRRLVEGMDAGNAREPPEVEGGRAALRMVTDLGAAAAALGDGAAEVALAAEGGRLVMRWRPARHVTPTAAAPTPRRAVLLEGVAGLQISYWGIPEGGGAPGWQGEWSGQALPGLVRFRLVFPAGSGRRWPDIVAAPRRERDGT